MTPDDHKALVTRFYREVWEARAIDAVPELLHPEFRFRGSLGDETRGHAAFLGYVDKVHQALGDYRCDIEALVAEGEQVFAKMRFGGVHRDQLLGHPASFRRVAWDGCALFGFRDGRIHDLWVLGDLAGLQAQLREPR